MQDLYSHSHRALARARDSHNLSIQFLYVSTQELRQHVSHFLRPHCRHITLSFYFLVLCSLRVSNDLISVAFWVRVAESPESPVVTYTGKLYTELLFQDESGSLMTYEYSTLKPVRDQA